MDLFPTPIAKYHHPDSEKLRDVILEIIKHIPKEDTIIGPGNITHYYNNGTFMENTNELTDFMEWVKSCVSNYAEQFLGMIGLEFVDLNVWVNSTDGGLQPGHIHNNSLISATYYVQLDPVKHVGLEVYNPRTIVSRNPLIDVNADVETPFNAKSVNLEVAQGDLLIWPSELLHGLTQPKVDVPRISLSMNFMPTVVKSHLYGFRVSKL